MNTFLDFAWTYLAVLDKCKYLIWTASFVALLALLALRLCAALPVHVVKYFWWCNIFLFMQFIFLGFVGLLAAFFYDKNVYYLVFNLFLLSWPYLIFCVISFFLIPANRN